MERTNHSSGPILDKDIELCKKYKKELYDYAKRLEFLYYRGKISLEEYHKRANQKLNGKTIQEWFNYYGSQIKEFQRIIDKRKKSFIFLFGLFILGFILFFIISSSGFQKTGLAVQDELNFSQDSNETLYSENLTGVSQNETSPFQEEPPVSEDIFEEINQTTDSENILGVSQNETSPFQEEPILSENISEVNIFTLNSKIVVGKPVKWIQKINIIAPNISDLRIEIPKNSNNLSIKTGKEAENSFKELEDENSQGFGNKEVSIKKGITGFVVSEKSNGPTFFSRFFEWLKGFTISGKIIYDLQVPLAEVNGNIIIDLDEIIDVQKEESIVIEYYTESPQSYEEETENGKRITISGPDELTYTDILAFTKISEKFDLEEKSKIKVYWREQNTYLDFTALDSDSNGKIDYIEWVVPHLSNQTFEIIFITKAEHLNENREFVSDIYDYVKKLDSNWSEEIPNQHYVRVSFEKNLRSENDITIFPRTVNGNPKIEIYEIDKNEIIAEFTSLVDNKYNKVFLTNLVGEQDTFDLKILDGSVELDYIVDPTSICGSGVCNVTFTARNDSWIVPTGVTSIKGLVIGGGGGGARTTSAGGGGAGGDVRYSSAISVTPGENLTVIVGYGGLGKATPGSEGGYSEIVRSSDGTVLLLAAGGGGGTVAANQSSNGTSTSIGGVINGGSGGRGGSATGNAGCGGGGGAGGMYGSGGAGGAVGANNGAVSIGGGGGGGGGSATGTGLCGGGGGVGFSIGGNNGTGGSNGNPANPGTGGSNGANGVGAVGGLYGGGGGGDDTGNSAGDGQNGSVFIIYSDPDVTNPSVTLLKEFPSNGSVYLSTQFYSFNATITDGVALSRVLLQFNNTNYTAVNTAGNIYNATISFSLPAGTYSYKWLANDTTNNWNATESGKYTINKTISQGTISGTSPITYGTTGDVQGSETNSGDGDVTYALLRNNISVSNPDATVLGVGEYTYVYNATEGQNYTVNSSIGGFTLTVNKATSVTNLTFGGVEGNRTITAGSSILLNGTILTGDLAATLRLYDNGTLINSRAMEVSNTTTYNDAGFHNITVVYQTSQNYTESSRTYYLNVTAVTNIAPRVTFIYNATPELVSGVTLTEGPAYTAIRINFSANDTDGFGDLTSPTLNISRAGEIIYHNSSCSLSQSGGNNANYTCLVNISWYSANGPWTINVSIRDALGEVAYNTNASYATINPLTGIQTGPGNLIFSSIFANQKNATFTNGPLLINNTGNQDFAYGQISVNASHLYGEIISTLAIWGGNFTVANNTGSNAECNFKGDVSNGNATRLLGNNSFTNINQANLSRGNFSLNNNEVGQEQLYICLLFVGTELTQQPYSTRNQGPWTIRILLVAFIPSGRKNRRKKKKQTEDVLDAIENNLNTTKEIDLGKLLRGVKINASQLLRNINGEAEIQIPLSILNEEIGVAEALCKYLKENLGLRFSEIAKLLNRDQRTVALNYKNALKKKQEKIKFTGGIVVPIKIFSDRRLSLLESVVNYLKEKGHTNIEISKILNKDPRNIWTLFSRAVKKLKK